MRYKKCQLLEFIKKYYIEIILIFLVITLSILGFTDIGKDKGLVAASVSLFVLIFLINQNRYDRKKIFHDLFTRFNNKYDKLNEYMNAIHEIGKGNFSKDIINEFLFNVDEDLRNKINELIRNLCEDTKRIEGDYFNEFYNDPRNKIKDCLIKYCEDSKNKTDNISKIIQERSENKIDYLLKLNYPGTRKTYEDIIFDYLNLCAEEYFWEEQGLIIKEAWENWSKGIEYFLDNPIIIEVIKSEKKKMEIIDKKNEIEINDFYYGFLYCDIVNKAIKKFE